MFKFVLRSGAWGKRQTYLASQDTILCHGCRARWHLATVRFLPLLAVGVLFNPPGAAAQDDNAARRIERSAAFIRENKLPEAERELSVVLKSAPNDADAVNLLGTVRARQGRLDEAEALFRRALRSDARHVGAHMNLAYLYMLQSSPEKAISELREMIRLDPTNSEANYKLARLLLSQGRVDQCIDFIEKTPAGSGAFLVAVLGDAYLRKGNAEKAEESYLLALNQHGDSEEALLGLAQVAQLKRDSRALPLYLSRAKELAGGSPDLLYKFATVALKLAAYEEARSALEDAVRLSPEEPAYFIALGVVWLNKPDVFEAEKAFRHALHLQPDSGRAQMYLGYAL